MKIQPEHAAHITAAVQAVDNPERRAKAQIGNHSNLRYRWDCLWAAGLTRWVCDNIYPYANDDHIDTVLRQAIPNLNN